MWVDEAARRLQATTTWLPFELHPETPEHGAPKPFSDEQWPLVRARLLALGEQVGLPIDPPRRNANSRRALEIGELVRERAGDAAAAAYHHALSAAFFTVQADISDPATIAAAAAPHGVTPADAARAWVERRYSAAIDASMRAAAIAGVSGVPAFAWPGRPAVAGMMEPERIVAILSRSRG